MTLGPSGHPRLRQVLVCVCLSALVFGCGGEVVPTPAGSPSAPCAEHNSLRNVYFGDLHVHTSYSFDAHAFDVRNTPEQAYRFAQGEAVSLPPLDANGQGTRTIRLDRPLDFAAVTDHSEFLGEVETCSVPGSPAYDSQSCQSFRAGGNQGIALFGIQLTRLHPSRLTDVCGVDGHGCMTQASEVWDRIVAAAEAAYDRSPRCSFTSFVAYEYSL